jgi:hypothetical protein
MHAHATRFGANCSTFMGSLTEVSVAYAAGGGLYQIVVDLSSFPTADGYVFTAAATVSGSILEATKIIRIDNSGPVVAMVRESCALQCVHCVGVVPVLPSMSVSYLVVPCLVVPCLVGPCLVVPCLVVVQDS